jgi:hypothetical protein
MVSQSETTLRPAVLARPSPREDVHGGLAVRVPIKTSRRNPRRRQKTTKLIHAHLRSQAELANALLNTTFKALRRVSLCPWRIGAITAAALVLLHQELSRTT